ncbi:MAG: hypothetical protein AB7E79_10685 [Rhodospirillaceae bacterium]
MQGRARRFVPAVVAVLVHAALLSGFLGLRPKAPAQAPEQVLPVIWIDRKPVALPPLAAPGGGRESAPPPVALSLPDAPVFPLPDAAMPLPLTDYVACGLGKTLSEEERSRCDRLRSELYGRPDAPLSGDYDLALQQRFSRDKALQDHPLLRLCYRRMGPDPVCFSRGYEVLYGAAASRDSIPLPIGDPLKGR